MEQLRRATEAFESGKQSRLREIERTAESQKSFLAQAKERIARLKEEVATIEEQIHQTREQLQNAQNVQVVCVDMDG